MLRLPRLTLTRAVAILAAFAVGYFLFSAVGDTLLSHRLGHDEDGVQQQIDDLERDEQRLLAIKTYLQTDEYIEGVARRVLGLVRPGESLVVVSSSVQPTPAPTPAEGAGTERWWEAIYGP